ncbi:MAG: hypothetical protein L6R37_005158 [Teloschistes peruensis]|nr:MAG: hypothetical protein L6R37_005158 [Teloschistes peruensis]
MAMKYLTPLLALALSVRGDNVPAFADHNAGWCYFCSDDGSPALCNSQCQTGINRLCAEDLSQNWIDIEGDCQLEFSPPVWGGKGGKPLAVTQSTCELTFEGILNMCGKDAGDPRNHFDPAYCTTSGGGGQYGWNDDGSVMTGTGRYKIIAKATDQCGQNEASWHQATSVIQWNDSWVGPNDQVILDTNPPASSINDFPEPPPPNPLCDQVVCDIFDHPYYAKKTKPNWQEKKGYLRYEARFQGFANDSGATAFKKSLNDRCHEDPYNFQPYFDGEEHVVDFELSAPEGDSHAWCISDGVYDASGGIRMDPKIWTEGAPSKGNLNEFASVSGAEIPGQAGYSASGGLRKRSTEEHGIKGDIGNFKLVSTEIGTGNTAKPRV